MDPTIQQLLAIYQAGHQGQMYPGLHQGGMFGGQQPPMGQQPMAQPMAPMQPPQMPPAQQDGQLPAISDPEEHKRKHGFNPLMMLSPFGGLMSSHPKYGLMAMSPGIGIANLLGAFK